MDEQFDRAITISFSLKQSELNKLIGLIRKANKDRSKLLTELINEKYSQEFPQPISLREEMDRL